MHIRKAEAQDLDALIALIKRRMAWMDEQGIRQWNSTDYLGVYPPSYFLSRIEAGEIFVAQDEEICGMAALLEEDDAGRRHIPAGFMFHHLTADAAYPAPARSCCGLPRPRQCRKDWKQCASTRSWAMAP